MRRGENAKKSLARVIWGWLLFVLILTGLVFVGIYFMGQRTVVLGNSMLPTLSDGDTVIIDRITYRILDPGRFDIIVFPFQYQDNTYYIKRVIGLPGETVQIIEGAVYINGEKLTEPFSFDEIRVSGLASAPMTLNENEYFVLGDNRNDSSDSREATVGCVRGEDIEGKVWLRMLPLKHFGFVK